MARFAKRTCRYCRGQGKVSARGPVRIWKTCVACDGFGFVFVPSDFVQCTDCGGTGRKRTEGKYADTTRCRRCRGTGWAGAVTSKA